MTEHAYCWHRRPALEMIKSVESSAERKEISSMPPESARRVEFEIRPPVSRAETPWEWMQGVFDREFPTPRWKRIFLSYLYLIIKSVPSSSNHDKSKVLYRHLPKAVGELQRLRRDVMDCLQWSRKSRLSTRLLTGGYIEDITSLIASINIKIANQLTNPNLNGWDERACVLFVEIQHNLSEVRPLYFATITFAEALDFQAVSSRLTDLRDNTLRRAGFQSVGVISYHAMTPDDYRRARYGRDRCKARERRLHVHLLFWPDRTADRDHVCRGLKSLRHALDRGRHGVGYYRISKIKGMLDFMKRAAYLAYNYSVSLKYQRGNEWNPIPSGGKLLRLPKNDRRVRRWRRRQDKRISTSQRAWEKAVAKYAERMAYDCRGFWIKQYADRIQELVEPEEWQDPKVNGLDGFEYLISPVPPSGKEQRYELRNPARSRWMISEEELKELGKLEVYPGALPCNPNIHPLDGERMRHPSSPRLPAKIVTGFVGVVLIGVIARLLLRKNTRT